MAVAAFILALIALVLSTASLTAIVTMHLLKRSEPTVPANELAEAAPAELEAYFSANTPAEQVLAQAADKRFEEALENPDAKFSGIDDSFNV